MVISFKDDTKIKIDVYLKDGRSYLGCDITPKPFGDLDRYVSFWFSDKNMVFSFDMIDHVELYEED